MIGFHVSCVFAGQECSLNLRESLHVVTIDESGNVRSASVAHHFPAIAVVHSFEFPPSRHFAPVVNGHQQHSGA
jgi:hypothetical protein